MKREKKPLLDDDTFIRQFEDLSLAADYFDHSGHLRISWLYLQHYDIDAAVERVCCGIKAYAGSLGATEKFHYTLSYAMVRIMAARITQQKSRSWPGFLAANRDLVEDAAAVIHQYYTPALLADERARVAVMPPDLKALV